MNKYKKITMVMCSLGLILLLTGVTYSFFNYTKTGNANNLGTGDISFNIDEGEAISLTNVFPMSEEEASEANLDTLTIGISGSTTYSSGEEFLISIVDVTKLNNKEIPINYIATYEETTGNSIGIEEDDYFTERESKSANIYLLNETGRVKEDKQVLVGFIKGGTGGIDGTLTIKAYVDADRIAITDTPTESSDWVNGRKVFSTTEWNSLKGNSAISFKLKAESYTKLWVEEPEPDNVTPESCFEKKFATVYTLNTNMTQTELNDCINYISSKNLDFDDNGTAEDYCLGTGKVYGETFQRALFYTSFDYYYLENHNIVTSESGIEITHYDSNCGGDLVFPNTMLYTRAIVNPNMTQSEINDCVNYYENVLGWIGDEYNELYGETREDFCNGTGAFDGQFFQYQLDNNYYANSYPDAFEYFKNHNIVVEVEEKKYPVLVYGSNMLDYGSVLSNISMNKDLRVISSYSLYGAKLSPSVNTIVVPNNVKLISSHESMIMYYSDSVQRNLELNILGKPYIAQFSLPTWYIVRYGGTCQELYNNSYLNPARGNLPSIFNGGVGGLFDIITTDTNTCKVLSDYYD